MAKPKWTVAVRDEKGGLVKKRSGLEKRRADKLAEEAMALGHEVTMEPDRKKPRYVNHPTSRRAAA